MGFEVKLKDLTSKIGSGATPRGGQAAYLEDGEIHLIRSQNIYNHKFEWNGIAYISEEQAEKLKNVIVEENDILINITGDSIARNMLASSEFLPARVNQHVSIIRCNQEVLDPAYLSAVLTSRNMQQQLLSLGQTGGTRAALTKGMLENLEVPIFNIQKQRSIGQILNMFNRKIENNNRVIENLEQLAQTLFKRWFVDFEFPNENGEPYKSSGGKMVESELGMVPYTWTVRNIKEFGEFKNGVNYSRDTIGDSRFRVCNVRNIVGKHYLVKDELDYISIDSSKAEGYLIRKGDTLIVRSASPGETVLINKTEKNLIYSGFVIRFRPNELENGSFLFFHLNRLKKELDSFSTGTTLKNLNQQILKSIKIIYPNNGDIIYRFHHEVSIFFNLIEECQEEIRMLNTLRDTLLPKLLSGEIELPGDMLV